MGLCYVSRSPRPTPAQRSSPKRPIVIPLRTSIKFNELRSIRLRMRRIDRALNFAALAVGAACEFNCPLRLFYGTAKPLANRLRQKRESLPCGSGRFRGT